MGRLFDSFAHTQIAYTSHCLERFSERADSNENCIIKMDSYMKEALLTYGENVGHLACPSGVFAYEFMDERMIIKTYINFNLLSDEQINKFHGSGTATVLPSECITDDHSQSDFKLIDENEESPDQPLT